MAEEAMANRETDVDFAVAQTELAIAIAQLAAIHKLRQKR
jgi:F-type H+-transporting ATPase subunit epsilon